jgi:hypothetical protein
MSGSLPEAGSPVILDFRMQILDLKLKTSLQGMHAPQSAIYNLQS